MLWVNLFLLSFVFAEDSTPLVQFTVVPDVIDKVPDQVLELTYSKNLIINQGITVTPTQVRDEPTVSWTAINGSFYTLVMIDPDAHIKEDPKPWEWWHWMVVNIPGNDIKNGEILAEYVGAGPPKGTGLHRYVFLVYEQPGIITFKEKKVDKKTAQNRADFTIREFAEKYELGEPIAASFFQAEYDDYVPILLKQFNL